MKIVTTSVVATVLAALAASSGAMAQPSYYDDMACRQYADQATAPMRDQANAQAVGSTLLGAGLGAALGGAIGGGRGAGIGAASGAFAGAVGGAAGSAEAAGYIQQQYNAHYAQCMSARAAPPPPQPRAYAPAPAYPPSGSSASQLNQQELNRTQAPPSGYYPPPPRY